MTLILRPARGIQYWQIAKHVRLVHANDSAGLLLLKEMTVNGCSMQEQASVPVDKTGRQYLSYVVASVHGTAESPTGPPQRRTPWSCHAQACAAQKHQVLVVGEDSSCSGQCSCSHNTAGPTFGVVRSSR